MSVKAEVARKRPANLPARGEADWVQEARPRDLYRRLARMSRRGELAEVGVAQRHHGAWRVRVVRIRPARRRWGRALLLGVLAAGALLAFLWALVELLQALAVALSALLPLALAFLVVVVLLLALAGRSAITVIQKVTIKR